MYHEGLLNPVKYLKIWRIFVRIVEIIQGKNSIGILGTLNTITIMSQTFLSHVKTVGKHLKNLNHLNHMLEENTTIKKCEHRQKRLIEIEKKSMTITRAICKEILTVIL